MEHCISTINNWIRTLTEWYSDKQNNHLQRYIKINKKKSKKKLISRGSWTGRGWRWTRSSPSRSRSTVGFFILWSSLTRSATARSINRTGSSSTRTRSSATILFRTSRPWSTPSRSLVTIRRLGTPTPAVSV